MSIAIADYISNISVTRVSVDWLLFYKRVMQQPYALLLFVNKSLLLLRGREFTFVFLGGSRPFGVERSGTGQNGCGAPRGGQAAGCVFFRTHSLYATGGNPPGLTVVILTRL